MTHELAGPKSSRAPLRDEHALLLSEVQSRFRSVPAGSDIDDWPDLELYRPLDYLHVMVRQQVVDAATGAPRRTANELAALVAPLQGELPQRFGDEQALTVRREDGRSIPCDLSAGESPAQGVPIHRRAIDRSGRSARHPGCRRDCRSIASARPWRTHRIIAAIPVPYGAGLPPLTGMVMDWHTLSRASPLARRGDRRSHGL